jgi:two-component system LytT family response regulator
MKPLVRALIIDDERLARQEMRRLLEVEPRVEIIGEARDADEAQVLILNLKPDLLFLDIQMPGRSGFDLLTELDEVPDVIFTTAYDEYAVRAFEANALDYLLKPVSPDRLAKALDRLDHCRGTPPPAPRCAIGPLNQVFVRDGERCWFVRTTEITLLESEGNYTRLFFGKERPLIPRSLVSLEPRLDSELFFRASRKHIFNLRAIESLETSVSGNLLVRLKGGLEVEMSRRQSQLFRDTMSL